MKLSVLMPVYNERDTVGEIARKVLEQRVEGVDETELVIVDDHSTDGTADIVRNLATCHSEQIRTDRHESNRGKGAAIRTATGLMTGDVCIIQDADLEYDPADYPLMLEPIITGRADCVIGSRFTGQQSKRVLYYWHYLGNRFLTILSNLFNNINLTDMECCYKAFRTDILRSIVIQSDRFGFEPEIMAKMARRKCRIFEVGIRYNGRTYAEGKKITWRDGFRAIFCIVRYGLFG